MNWWLRRQPEAALMAKGRRQDIMVRVPLKPIKQATSPRSNK